MSDDYKIYVDAGHPATLNDGAGVLTDCATLQEAVLAWHRLAPEQKIRATVKVIGGRVYRAHEIERLHYEPKRDESAAGVRCEAFGGLIVLIRPDWKIGRGFKFKSARVAGPNIADASFAHAL